MRKKTCLWTFGWPLSLLRNGQSRRKAGLGEGWMVIDYLNQLHGAKGIISICNPETRGKEYLTCNLLVKDIEKRY